MSENLNPLQGIQIPAQPHIIAEIKEASDDIKKVSTLISQDPSIAAAVLKIINSAAFGFKAQISSIERAVMLLGMVRIQALVNSQVLKSSLTGLDAQEATAFWDSANDVAMASYLLATELRREEINIDDAYTVGLFHNCGIIAMAQKNEGYLSVVREAYQQNDGADLTALEDIRFQCNHALVGYHIAKNWRLPEHLTQVILHHHDLTYINQGVMDDNADTFRMLAVLKAAEHISGLRMSLGLSLIHI